MTLPSQECAPHLSRCPFCGSEARFYENEVDFVTKWSVLCSGCNVNLDACEDDKIGAANVWNTRAAGAPTEPTALLNAIIWARKRLERWADEANAGLVHYSPRELKRKIWGAFADVDALIPEPSAWQPIATAPQDGTEILLWWKHCRTPSVGSWSIDDLHAERTWAHKALEEGWRCEGDACIPVNQADCTHWQPLPAGPESAQPTKAISSNARGGETA